MNKPHDNENCTIPFCKDCLDNIKSVARKRREQLDKVITPPDSEAYPWLDELVRDIMRVPYSKHKAKAAIAQHIREIETSYGGCHLCYGYGNGYGDGYGGIL